MSSTLPRCTSGATAAAHTTRRTTANGTLAHPARRAAAAAPAPRTGSPAFPAGPPQPAARRAAAVRAAAAPATAPAAAAAARPSSEEFALNTLTTWLLQQEKAGRVDFDLMAVVSSIATACKQISALVARAPLVNLTGAVAAVNASGDEQKKLDIIANDIFTAAVANCGRTGITVSEEEEGPIAVDVVAGGNYIVAFDPIDGSSNLDACISSGSIFGIYSPGECAISDEDSPEAVLEKCTTNVRKSGNELVAAGYCLYSSATILVLTLGDGVFSFMLDRGIGEFILTDSHMKIPDPGQTIYSGNEGNTSLWDPDLKDYLSELKAGGKPYSYRYVGALVGDFHRTLCYGGIWLYPPDSKAPSGKARLLYEVAPMSMIAEQAGGLACVGPTAETRVLDIVPKKVHEKSPLFVGSASEVRKLQAFLKARKG